MLSRVELCRTVFICLSLYTHPLAVVTHFSILQPIRCMDFLNMYSFHIFDQIPVNYVNSIHTADAAESKLFAN